jgi:hypothetical protein
MIIMGSVTPMQHQLRWNQRPIQAALEGSRLLIGAPRTSAGPLQLIGLITSTVWKVRQGPPVESLMPLDLRARFVAARTRANQPESRYTHWKPAVAGFLLLSDYRRALGYSEGKPGTKVEAFARQKHVPIVPVENYNAEQLIKVAIKLSDQQNMNCLAYALDELEYEGAHVQDLNNDWARGDVRAIDARYRLPALQRCLMQSPAAQALIEQQMSHAADRLWDELRKPGKTVAVIDMAWLLPRDGILDRLKAKGAVVSEPAPPPPSAVADDAP